MGQLVFQANAGGQTALVGPNPSTSISINIPATNGNMVTTGDSGTVTNTMLASSAYTAPGTIGSGTPNTGSFTNLAYTGTLTGGTGVVNLGSGQFYKDASGNVGIGQSSLSERFTVYSTSGNARALMDSGANQVYLGWDAGAAIAENATNGAWRVRTGGGFTEAMRITSSGALLVGTSTGSNTNGVAISKGGAAGGGIVELFKTVSGLTNGLLNYYGTTYVGGINFDNTSTSFPTSSDIRLKKNIVDAPSAISKVQNIRIVSHGWKNDDAIVEFGVIAQELASVAPSAVMQGDNGEEVVTTWSVDYSKLVPILTKAIQEQQAMIETLTTRLNTLEGK
jgi:hypothetical protein